MAENNAKWLDAAYYQNIPSSEVNWAQLAQKWMQMRDAGELPPAPPSDPIPPPPNKEPPPPRPPLPDELPVNGSFLPPGGYLPAMPVEYSAAPPCWIPPMPANNFGPSGGPFPPFMPPVPPWLGSSPAPPGPFPPNAIYNDAKRNTEEEEGGEYSHYYKEWDEKQKRSRPDNDTDDTESVPEGAMAHWLTPGPGWAPPPNWFRPSHRESSSSHMPYIDNQTRKALPAWIREGLEKAEQEKQKKQLKEAKLRAAEEAAKARRAAKGLGKFDSDSSEDENERENVDENSKLDGEPVFLQKRNQKQQKQENLDTEELEADYRTEEEKREDALMLLRRFMTEVLLETTDNELDRIIVEQIEFAKRSAQPKVLAQSSALAALSALGAGSDDESDDESSAIQQEGDESRTLEEVSTKPIGNGGDVVFSVPLLPVSSSGAKSKAKLSTNDGFSSTESSQGVEKKDTVIQGKKNDDEESSRITSPENADNAFKEMNEVSGEKKSDSIKNEKIKDRKVKHIGELKRLERKKSKSKERLRKRRHRDEKEELTRKSSERSSDIVHSDRSESQTPERYRHRSSSEESHKKRRRSKSRRRSRSRSRSHARERRRFQERRRSRSRNRERQRSRDRYRRERYRRKSRS